MILGQPPLTRLFGFDSSLVITVHLRLSSHVFPEHHDDSLNSIPPNLDISTAVAACPLISYTTQWLHVFFRTTRVL